MSTVNQGTVTSTTDWVYIDLRQPRTRPVDPVRDDYAWDAAAGWCISTYVDHLHVDQFRVVS